MARRETQGERHSGLIPFLNRAFGRFFGGAPKGGGAYWEGRAARFLRKKKYRIRARNVRMRRGEIDIVAADGDVIVFVEVKQRKGDEFGGGAYAIDSRKRRKLISAAKEFLLREKLNARPCRFDTVVIDTSAQPPEFTHVENAFEDETR